MKRMFTSIIILLLFAGCGAQRAYRGEQRSSDQLSIISFSLFQFGPTLIIKEVDGIKIGTLNSGTFEVLPGRHTIKVFLFSSGGRFGSLPTKTSPIEMTFDTEPGKKYVVDYKSGEGSQWVYFITEKESGEVIYEVVQ